MPLWTIIAPYIGDLAERLIEAMREPVPCKHKDGVCHQGTHMRPTPAGAIVGLTVFACLGYGLFAISSLDERVARVEEILMGKSTQTAQKEKAPVSIITSAEGGTK